MEKTLEKLSVIKRNGKKVDFDGSKIALAIKKGFDNAIIVDNDHEDGTSKYSTKDVQIVYKEVIDRIEKDFKNEDKIKIEQIQDMIEDA